MITTGGTTVASGVGAREGAAELGAAVGGATQPSACSLQTWVPGHWTPRAAPAHTPRMSVLCAKTTTGAHVSAPSQYEPSSQKPAMLIEHEPLATTAHWVADVATSEALTTSVALSSCQTI